MSDIQRHELRTFFIMLDHKMHSMVFKQDHLKAIEAKDKEIVQLKEALKNALDGYARSDMLFKEEIEEIIELRKLTK